MPKRNKPIKSKTNNQKIPGFLARIRRLKMLRPFKNHSKNNK